MNRKQILMKEIELLTKSGDESYRNAELLSDELSIINGDELCESIRGTYWKVAPKRSGEFSLRAPHLGYDDVTDAITDHHSHIDLGHMFEEHLSIHFSDGDWFIEGEPHTIILFAKKYFLTIDTSGVSATLAQIRKRIVPLESLLEMFEMPEDE